MSKKNNKFPQGSAATHQGVLQSLMTTTLHIYDWASQHKNFSKQFSRVILTDGGMFFDPWCQTTWYYVTILHHLIYVLLAISSADIWTLSSHAMIHIKQDPQYLTYCIFTVSSTNSRLSNRQRFWPTAYSQSPQPIADWATDKDWGQLTPQNRVA